jgi:hypothetical protein
MCRNFTETSLLKQTNERWVVKVIHHSLFAIRCRLWLGRNFALPNFSSPVPRPSSRFKSGGFNTLNFSLRTQHPAPTHKPAPQRPAPICRR